MTAEPLPPQSPRIPPSWVAPVTQLHIRTEVELIALLAGRLASDLGAPDWPARKLAELPRLRRDIDALVTALTRAGTPLVADTITRAYREAFPPGGEDRAGQPATLIGRVLAALRAAWARIRSEALAVWNRAVGAGHNPDTRRAAVQQVLNRAAGRGIVAFQGGGGRQYGLGSYADTVIGDAAHGAGIEGFTDWLADDGGDLVIVSESPHPCLICRPWEHRVLSVSGMDSGRPSLASARAAGLFHPHCRHTIVAWKPGFRWPPHSVERKSGTYEAEQRQRAIERHIRDWKRREAAALDDLAAARARKRVRAWQAELRAHLARSGLQRSRMRERVDFARTAPLRHAHG